MKPNHNKPKYRVLVDKLAAEIRAGKYQPGERLPSEAALVQRFEISRITVGRALGILEQRGIVERRAGSGTYVHREAHAVSEDPLLFGLLIPDLGETEIFGPICQGIADAPDAADHALLWGHAEGTSGHNGKQERARSLCRQYIARKVSGVFFAPLEFERDAEKTNRAILAAFANSRTPVVLLDHRPSRAAEGKRRDLAGLNNRQAGFLATEHLIQLGCRRIGFLGYHGATAPIAARAEGYRAALEEHSLPVREDTLPSAESGEWTDESIEAWVCVNDRVAGLFMRSLQAAKLRIPEDLRVVGIDDASYASLLPVPLTTVRQPCRLIGEAALALMLARIRDPQAPARDVLLDGELIIRSSCGGSPRGSN